MLLPPARPGFHQVNVEISPARDTVPGNDLGEGLFQVLGAQQVLVVAGSPGAGYQRRRAPSVPPGSTPPSSAPAEVPVTVLGRRPLAIRGPGQRQRR